MEANVKTGFTALNDDEMMSFSGGSKIGLAKNVCKWVFRVTGIAEIVEYVVDYVTDLFD